MLISLQSKRTRNFCVTISEPIQGSGSYDSAGIPFKRKQGWPRKDKSLYCGLSVSPRDLDNLLRILKGVHVNTDDDASIKVGHAVIVTAKSVLDAGYLIAKKLAIQISP